MELPYLYQIRKNCIISYPNRSYLDKKVSAEQKKNQKIKTQKTFTESAKKKMKRILDVWQYTIDGSAKELSFITLTISSGMKNEIDYYSYLKSWLEKIQLRYGKFNYVWKLEYQKNGNLHYHLMLDVVVDWRICRSQWNKIQNVHVDEYQSKMKRKYKNGYFFDVTMLDYKGEIVSEEVQANRYKKGYKANWRNPNSTDVKCVNVDDGIASYISKYLNKNEDDEEVSKSSKITRFWGCSDKLKEIKFAVLEEEVMLYEEVQAITGSLIKKIEDEHYNVLCFVYEKVKVSAVAEAEAEVLKRNRDLLAFREVEEKRKKKNESENLSYKKLFEDDIF